EATAGRAVASTTPATTGPGAWCDGWDVAGRSREAGAATLSSRRRCVTGFRRSGARRRARAAADFSDAQPDEGALQRGLRGRQVFPGLAPLEREARPLARPLGTLDVDLLGVLGGIGEDHDVVVEDLEEAAGDGERDLLGAALEDQLAGRERRHERRMTREHGELALDAGRDHLVDAG